MHNGDAKCGPGVAHCPSQRPGGIQYVFRSTGQTFTPYLVWRKRDGDLRYVAANGVGSD